MKQVYAPDLKVPATRGWCLKYIDDAGSAPARRPSAQAAYQVEANAKRIRNNQSFPVNVWVVGFFSLNSGPYEGLGHVVFIKKHESGRVEIRDSETRSGARAVYSSVGQVLQWFGNHSPKYLGWSTHCDGRQYAASKPKPKPKPKPTPKPKPKPKPPVKKYHTIRKGEYASGIAKKYGISLAKLKKLNPKHKNWNLIYPGKKLRVK